MASNKNLLVLPGDGIGPEVMREVLRVIEWMDKRRAVTFDITEGKVGGTAIDTHGTPLADETLADALSADATLLGAVGGPKWESLPFDQQPERGLLRLRKEMDLFANLRPALCFEALVDASTLKPEIVSGLDILIVRELTSGVYFGEPRGVEMRNGERVGFNTLIYSESEIRRIAKVGFEIAMKRNKKLTSVDKANVLESTELWREITTEVGKDFPEVELSHMYADNAAMQIIRNPKQFDTMVTTNMFGDILSDAAAMMTGSLGMLPSASIGGTNGMYEPVHGSAPDISGQDKANPLATILSVGMMLRYSFDLTEADEMIKQAVVKTLETYRTIDIMAEGKTLIGCQEMGERVLQSLEQL